MIKKLLFSILIMLLPVLLSAQQTITFTTTSTSDSWSPASVTNSGETLVWNATGGGIIDQTDPANTPIFDLSDNNGTVTITAESNTNFAGLTRLYMQALSLTSANVDEAVDLVRLYLFSNQLNDLNISQNTVLENLRVNGGNSITALDVSNNSALIDLRAQDNALPSTELDAIVGDLAAFNELDGNLQIAGNAGGLTTDAIDDYTILDDNFWTIDVASPVIDIEPPVIGVLNTPTNVLQTSLTLSWTAATDNVGVTNYNIFQDGGLIATTGNVLSFDVTGLTIDTNYDFYITALDNEGNESAASNTQNVSTIAASNSIVFTTTSSSGSWSPAAVTNSGATLVWTATGGGILEQTDPSNVPNFDLSDNSGTVTITAESSDGFNGLTRLYMQALNISSANIDNAIALSRLYLFSNQIPAINLSQNTLLESVRLQGGNSISSLDVSNNSFLTDLRVQDNNLPSGDLDAIVNSLAGFGETDGNLQISGNAGGLTSASSAGYTTLEDNFWFIDVTAPIEDNEPPVIGVLNVPTNILQTSLTLDWTAATDNVGVTNYNIFQDGSLVATVGNVLTYDVTGLTAGTNYDFYITALDNAGNESSASNTQNATTIPLTSTIVFTTTSTDPLWSPASVTNNGATLVWTATGGGIVDQTDPSNDPTFDLSDNSGTVTITAESSDGFSGLTRLYLQALNITTADVDNATALARLYLFTNQISVLNVSQNTLLESLRLQGGNSIASLDVGSNSILTDLRVQDNSLPSGDLDAIVNSLAGFGETDGNLQISGNTGSLTSAAAAGYTTLEDNFWFIDVSAPIGDNEPPVIGVLNAPTNILQTSLTLDWTAATDNVGVTNYNIFQDGSLIATVGNVLTYDVTGLTADTNYDFYITALDNEGNESDLSNTQNTTTIPLVSTITFTTTSNSNSWTPSRVNNNGATLVWNATGGGIVDQTDPSNVPTFDLTNNGGTVTITAESTDGFNGLLDLNLQSLNITTADVDNAIALRTLYLFLNQLSSLDISQNGSLTGVRVNGGNLITSFDVSNNPLLIDLRIQDNALPSGDLDAIVNDLAGFGELNGNLQISGNVGSLTTASSAGYTTLDVNNWTIDVDAPGVSGPQINITGNGIDIGNPNTPDVADGTNFEQVLIGGSVSSIFTIENVGNEILTINGIFGITPPYEITVSPSSSIAPGSSSDFEVTYTPTVSGQVDNAAAIIIHNDTDLGDNPFVLNLTGQGVDNIVTGDLMISQYYAASNGTDRWIEVKNVSGAPIAVNTYFLNRYLQGSDTSVAPAFSEPIPAMGIDEILLFKSNTSVLPGIGNLGTATIITTNVADFESDDIVIISSSSDASSYASREDVVITVPAISLIRGGSNEQPEVDFNVNNWIQLSPSGDVNTASPSQNIALGTQEVGTLIWNGAAWNGSTTPDFTRNVQISGNLIATSTLECNDLQIDAGQNLDLDNGLSNSVVVYNDLTINGAFIIGDQESLVMINDNATITGSVTKLENSTLMSNSSDFTYWSSPVETPAISSVFAGVDPGRIYQYNRANTDISDAPDDQFDPNDPNFAYYSVWENASGVMTRARGYASEGLSGTTGIHGISFSGAPHNGVIQFDVFDWNDGNPENDYNLIGNPYPSAIDIDEFLLFNASIIEYEIFLWTHATPISDGDSGDFFSSDYATYNITGGTGVGGGPIPEYNIGSGQGFMIRASEGATGLVQFNNSMRRKEVNTQFFKSSNTKNKSLAKATSEEDRVWLNLTSDKQGFSQILVGFMSPATDDVDKGYDTKRLSDNPLQFYSKIGDEKFVIQAVGDFSNEREVALGFDLGVAPRTLTISIERIEGQLSNENVYLVDHLLNISHDLNVSDYIFDQNVEGEFPDRFTLRFVDTDIAARPINGGKHNIVISNQVDALKIDSKEQVNKIKVYDVFGRLIEEGNPKEKSFIINMEKIKPGTVLILESYMEDGTVINKKAIRY